MTRIQNFIGGAWVDAVSGETFESTSPASGELIGIFPKSGADDVDRAVEAAKKRFARLEHVGEWRLHARLFEVEALVEVQSGAALPADPVEARSAGRGRRPSRK